MELWMCDNGNGGVIYYTRENLEAVFSLIKGKPDAIGTAFRGRAPETFEDFVRVCELCGIRKVVA